MAWILELQKQGNKLAEKALLTADEGAEDEEKPSTSNSTNAANTRRMISVADELIPFYTYTDLYLRPIHKIAINVTLPKLRQMGQSVSNWEIRERLKKMLGKIELNDFKVLESTLEEVQFVVTVNTEVDVENVIQLLNGITFRAVGFTEPLSVKTNRAKLDFPTRIDWDQFFSANSDQMDEQEPGERPDTIYISGLPFDWFQSTVDESTEKIFKRIFSEYGDVTLVDIPQCDPLRKQMESEISGIQCSSWLFGQDTFFEVYIQFREYASFVNAISVLGGKLLVQKCPNGVLREAKIKVDFDRTAHLSIRKITKRKLRRMCLEYERNKLEQKEMDETKRLEEMILEEKGKRERDERERVVKAMLRAERRQRIREKRDFEHLLRKKLKNQLTRKLETIWKERQQQAKRLFSYIAKMYRTQKKRKEHKRRRRAATVQKIAEEYIQEMGLPTEEEIRQRILRKRELQIRTRMTGRLLSMEAKKIRRN